MLSYSIVFQLVMLCTLLLETLYETLKNIYRGNSIGLFYNYQNSSIMRCIFKSQTTIECHPILNPRNILNFFSRKFVE